VEAVPQHGVAVPGIDQHTGAVVIGDLVACAGDRPADIIVGSSNLDVDPVIAIARKLLVAVWHILTYEAVDCHADEKSVAASFINLAYKMGTKNLPPGISAKAFARQQMDRLKIGAWITTVPWGSRRIVLPPSHLKE
jgi:hypothetical protein